MKKSCEQIVVDALANPRIASTELFEVVRHVEVELAHQENAEAVQREVSLDPAQSPEPKAAREALEDIRFARERLGRQLPLLRAHLETRLDDEARAKYDGEYSILDKMCGQAALRFQRIDELIAEMVDIFKETAEVDRRIADLHSRAPIGESRRLAGPEIRARQLLSFSRSKPSILRELRLVNFAGEVLWPPPQPSVASVLPPVIDRRKHPDEFSNRWWVAQAEAQNSS